MTPTALKEAAQVGVPRDKIVGNRVLCSEQGMVLPGGGDRLHLRQLSGHGDPLPLIQEMLHYVYARGKGLGPEGDVGTAFWNLGVLDGVLTTEGYPHGHAPLRQSAPRRGRRCNGDSSTSPSRPRISRNWERRGCSHRSPSPVAIMRERRGEVPAVGRQAVDRAHRLDGADQALVRPWWRHRRQVCAGEGDHTTSLPVGAWSLWSGGRAPWEEGRATPWGRPSHAHLTIACRRRLTAAPDAWRSASMARRKET